MNKELLALFRKIFSVDDKVLPDTMTPEDFGKFIENQAGKLFIKPEDLKNLQKKLTEKDIVIKDFEKKIKDNNENSNVDPSLKALLDQFSEMKTEIKQLSDSIVSKNKEIRLKELSTKYPDISPTLLSNISDDDIEKIVEEQRSIARKHYKGAEVFTKPNYTSADQIDTEIESIKNNKNLTALQKSSEIMKLNRVRADIFPPTE